MMPNTQKAVVLLPTYNEFANLSKIVPAILAAAPVDVMILDDNSPDGTGQLADSLAENNPRIMVVHRPLKEGLGAAYIDGFRRALKAGYDPILQMDADFSHPPRQLKTILNRSKSYDLVLGSRWIKGGGTKNWSKRRQFISRMGSLYARTILGVGVRDLTGGYKCFRRHVLESIDLSSIQAEGYAFQIEMTYRAIQGGFSAIESPIIFTERQEGVSKMSRGIIVEALRKVPALRFRNP